MCYNRAKGEQKGNRVMAVTNQEQGSAAAIRELRGVVVDLASGVGRLDGLMWGGLGLMLP